MDGDDPRLSCQPSGTGDLFTALFTAGLVEGLSTPSALGRAVSYEIAIIASAERMVRPDRLFAPSVIRSDTDAPRPPANTAPV